MPAWPYSTLVAALPIFWASGPVFRFFNALIIVKCQPPVTALKFSLHIAYRPAPSKRCEQLRPRPCRGPRNP